MCTFHEALAGGRNDRRSQPPARTGHAVLSRAPGAEVSHFSGPRRFRPARSLCLRHQLPDRILRTGRQHRNLRGCTLSPPPQWRGPCGRAPGEARQSHGGRHLWAGRRAHRSGRRFRSFHPRQGGAGSYRLGQALGITELLSLRSVSHGGRVRASGPPGRGLGRNRLRQHRQYGGPRATRAYFAAGGRYSDRRASVRAGSPAIPKFYFFCGASGHSGRYVVPGARLRLVRVEPHQFVAVRGCTRSGFPSGAADPASRQRAPIEERLAPVLFETGERITLGIAHIAHVLVRDDLRGIAFSWGQLPDRNRKGCLGDASTCLVSRCPSSPPSGFHQNESYKDTLPNTSERRRPMKTAASPPKLDPATTLRAALVTWNRLDEKGRRCCGPSSRIVLRTLVRQTRPVCGDQKCAGWHRSPQGPRWESGQKRRSGRPATAEIVVQAYPAGDLPIAVDGRQGRTTAIGEALGALPPVVDRPPQLPALASVGGLLPVPVKLFGRDVLEHHALNHPGAVRTHRLAP